MNDDGKTHRTMNDQRALDDQLDDLERICAERGLYDAQDWLRSTRSAHCARLAAARAPSETDARDDTSGGRPKRVQKKPKETQKQKLDLFKREALSAMAAYEDSFPLGHYFMWAIVNVGGKRKYRVCIGSGRSSRMEDARAAVAAMPGVDHAWYNLD